ncbi:MAG: hypothetical protein ABW170_23440 [Candidatus Thiodiazotropha sp. L084R]
MDLNPIRASIADTPEDSDFTSIQERLKAYVQQQKSIEAKQPQTKLYPFVTTSGSDAVDGIDFNVEDYFKLIDWTGRAIRDDKRGSIPEELASILERLNLKPDAWLKSLNHYNSHYFTVLGEIDRIKDYAMVMGKCWFQGQSAAKNNYRVVVNQ